MIKSVRFHGDIPIDTRILFDYNSQIKQYMEDLIMKTAAVSELKSLLSKYLSKVKAGEEVMITDRGKPVAKLVPISRTDMGLFSIILLHIRAKADGLEQGIRFFLSGLNRRHIFHIFVCRVHIFAAIPGFACCQDQF